MSVQRRERRLTEQAHDPSPGLGVCLLLRARNLQGFAKCGLVLEHLVIHVGPQVADGFAVDLDSDISRRSFWRQVDTRDHGHALRAVHSLRSERLRPAHLIRSPDDLRESQMTGCSSLYAPAVAKFEYDEEASAAWRLDVVHDVRQDKPVPVTRWIEAMRRLNAIRDPLARQILVLDRECGSGTGTCDNADDVVPEIADRLRWGCKTTEVIAGSFRCRVPRATRALNALDPVTPRSTRSSPSYRSRHSAARWRCSYSRMR